MPAARRGPIRRVLAVTVIAAGISGSCMAEESRDQWQQPERVVGDLGLRAGARVADVGCGSGYFTVRLAKAVGGDGVVFAVDPSTKALDGLRSQLSQANAHNVEIIRSKGSTTGLADTSCDAVLICNVLHEVSPPSVRAELMRDIARAMRPGGSLYLLDYRKSQEATRFDPFEKLIAREDLVRLATEAGLQLDAEFHYLKYQVFLRFRKPITR
ncbi:MAG: class I SAM-dependent methyltransferase [Verrucomicrobiae bacterium]|nr:class I SAM-dependent methyltransferase [Verrucomicrobiae bacterium]